MDKIIYAIKVADLAYSGLKIIDVKIGQTVGIDSTLRQYRRSNPNAEILDLWETNTNAYDCEAGVHKIAEKYAYRRKKETFIFLQESYKEFAENVNLLLKNITGSKTKKQGKTKKGEYRRSGYTAKKPYLIKFLGKEYSVNTWRELLCKVAEEIYRHKGDFTPALNIKGSKRIYFSKNSKELVEPLEIKGTPYFCGGNLSANQIVKIANLLLEAFGYKPQDLEIEYK